MTFPLSFFCSQESVYQPAWSLEFVCYGFDDIKDAQKVCNDPTSKHRRRWLRWLWPPNHFQWKAPTTIFQCNQWQPYTPPLALSVSPRTCLLANIQQQSELCCTRANQGSGLWKSSARPCSRLGNIGKTLYVEFYSCKTLHMSSVGSASISQTRVRYPGQFCMHHFLFLFLKNGMWKARFCAQEIQTFNRVLMKILLRNIVPWKLFR